MFGVKQKVLFRKADQDQPPSDQLALHFHILMP